ncbi:MAG: hypothetical protein KDN19_21510 [Verrucomicrobiae bacterium]|nr:hypothetical protein [Verrucomicrobiae bacterium]
MLFALAGGLILVLLMVRHWSPSHVIERQQRALINALQDRSPKKLDRLLADNYLDQWEFDREKIKLALQDFGSQFIILTLITEESETTRSDENATIMTRLNVSGNGSPLAHEMIRTANQLKEPFVFYWEKQSAWPGDWKLVRIENPSLASELRGYQPGDLKRALDLN